MLRTTSFLVLALILALTANAGAQLLLLGAGAPGNPVYFVDASAGNDSNPGTIALPWQTLHKVNNSVFPVGSTVNFKGSFSGGDNGLIITTTVVPSGGIVLTSYSTGATITSGNSTECVKATNVSSVVISNLTCVGGSDTVSTTNGILITNGQNGDTQLTGPTLSGNTISSYGSSGIFITGTNGKSGFTNILVTSNTIHDVGGHDTVGGASCFLMQSGTGYGTKTVFNNITISNNTAYNCIGSTGTGTWSGSGIFVGQVTNANIANNIVHDVGSAGEALVGIWTGDSANVTMQFNEVYNVLTTSTDGGGFDCDGGVSTCLVQYNYIHDNQGACIQFYSYTDSKVTTWQNGIARFNICQNNNTGGTVGEMRLDSDGVALTGAQVYNNTFYALPTQGVALSSHGSSVDLGPGTIANNIFYGSATHTLVNIGTHGTALSLNGNDYFGSAKFTYNGSNYTTYAAFKSGSSQETINGGFTSDPQLVNAGGGGTLGGYVPASLSAYELVTGSPMLASAGINLTTSFSISPGTQDFYETAVTAATLPVGASQASQAAPTWGGPTASLIHRWQMNIAGNTGNIVHDLAGSDNGTPTGTPGAALAPSGAFTSSALSFNGTTDYLTLASNPITISGPFTIAFWANLPDITFEPDGAGTDPRVFNFTDATHWLVCVNYIQGGNPGSPGCDNDAATFTPTSNVAQWTNNTWGHFAVTWDGASSTILYFNGLPIAIAAAPQADPGTTGANIIAARGDANRKFKGALYQFVIYSSALSGSAITQLYNAK